MSNRAIVTLKVIVFTACLIPLGLLVKGGLQQDLGADPVNTITHATGNWTLYFLLASLAITPVRRLSSKLNWLIRFRRMLGLFAFFYATLHLTAYIWLYSAFNVPAMIDDIVKRKFITIGLLGWLVLLPLALTSTLWSIRKLGGKRWQLLHRLAYVAAIAGVTHFWWLVKPGVRTPMRDTVVLILLLLARMVWSIYKRKKRSSKPAVSAQPVSTSVG
ncbi:MAG: protein-methionine-sulfoxide reductase heme-binding subunit MsrQ [Acidobacteriaceae bacterium]